MLDFRKWYLQMKDEGYTDREISLELHIDLTTLKNRKKFYGLTGVRSPVRKNNQGLTQDDLREAEGNGISRRNALKRRRVLRWEKEEAISREVRMRKLKND